MNVKGTPDRSLTEIFWLFPIFHLLRFLPNSNIKLMVIAPISSATAVVVVSGEAVVVVRHCPSTKSP